MLSEERLLQFNYSAKNVHQLRLQTNMTSLELFDNHCTRKIINHSSFRSSVYQEITTIWVNERDALTKPWAYIHRLDNKSILNISHNTLNILNGCASIFSHMAHIWRFLNKTKKNSQSRPQSAELKPKHISIRPPNWACPLSYNLGDICILLILIPNCKYLA